MAADPLPLPPLPAGPLSMNQAITLARYCCPKCDGGLSGVTVWRPGEGQQVTVICVPCEVRDVRVIKAGKAKGVTDD